MVMTRMIIIRKINNSNKNSVIDGDDKDDNYKEN